eukprot:Sspe_Gene.45103::Locus_22246_Transcript_1_1_Confidence_1.000_Length_2210::g.45103::m.45103
MSDDPPRSVKRSTTPDETLAKKPKGETESAGKPDLVPNDFELAPDARADASPGIGPGVIPTSVPDEMDVVQLMEIALKNVRDDSAPKRAKEISSAMRKDYFNSVKDIREFCQDAQSFRNYARQMEMPFPFICNLTAALYPGEAHGPAQGTSIEAGGSMWSGLGGVPGKRVYFDEWKGVPDNGMGSLGHTVLPMKKVVDELGGLRAGMRWLEAPMRSGKTTLAQIISQKCNFERIIVSKIAGNVGPSFEGGVDSKLGNYKLRGNVVIDEAQCLHPSAVHTLRAFSNDHVVLLFGVSCTMVSPCDRCKKPSELFCSKCGGYKCCHDSRCADPAFHSSYSQSFDNAQRIPPTMLDADLEEMETWLTLSQQDLKIPVIPDVGEVGEWLLSICGKQLGVVMYVVKFVFDELAPRDGVRCELSVGDCISFWDEGAIQRATHDKLRVTKVVLPDGSAPFACKLVNGEKLQFTPEADPLRRLGFAVGQNRLRIRSPLHQLFLQSVLRRSDRPSYTTIGELVGAVAHRLNKGWVTDSIPVLLEREARLNAHLNVLFRELSGACLTVRAEHPVKTGCIDHTIMDHPQLESIGIEVMLFSQASPDRVNEHLGRFGPSNTRYPSSGRYSGFDTRVLLCFVQVNDSSHKVLQKGSGHAAFFLFVHDSTKIYVEQK